MVTQPLDSGRHKIGLDTRMGLKLNLQPKLRALSLMKDTDMIGLYTITTLVDIAYSHLTVSHCT